MKLLLCLGLLAAVAAQGADPAPKNSPPLQPPPAVTPAAPRPLPAGTYTYDQKPLASVPELVSKEQAQGIVERFKATCQKLHSPRFLIYVNRELVDRDSGLRLSARTEKTETARSEIQSTAQGTNAAGPITIRAGRDVRLKGGRGFDFPGKGEVSRRSDRVANENRYRVQERERPLADRQTVRDLERLIGRPLRAAGASLADQDVATQLMADKPLQSFTVPTEGEAARKDREALGKITDVVIEVLLSSRQVTVTDLSGDKTYTTPDLQLTAIRLSDSKILGQASGRDILGRDRNAGRVLRYYDVQDIAEAVALALMEDMALGQ